MFIYNHVVHGYSLDRSRAEHKGEKILKLLYRITTPLAGWFCQLCSMVCNTDECSLMNIAKNNQYKFKYFDIDHCVI